MALDSSFGEYITKEYGLLKQILSYLKPYDLWNAKLVCQDWNRAVESLIDKNPTMVICEMDKNTTPFFANRKPILPALVLHQPPDHSLEGRPLILCRKCDLPFILGLCPCTLVGPDTVYVSVSTNTCESYEPCDQNHASSFYRFCQMFMGFVLPASEKIQVSVFYAEPKDPIFKQSITEEIVDRCIGGHEPIKCLLILMKTGGNTKWLNKMLTQVVYRQGMTFAIGGGEVSDIEYQTRAKGLGRLWPRCDLVLIALRGDNVVAHSDILGATSQQEIEKFMEKLVKRVGPLPEGATRMAFLAQCVNRTEDPVETIECSAFKKAFPSVPLFGMQAYGEFGVRSMTKGMGLGSNEQNIKRRRMNLTFDDSGTSSFVILTFKHV